MTVSDFGAVVAPLLTPFDADMAPDKDAYLAHARACLDDGCTGLVPFGTTGEAASLALDEREGLLDALVAGGIAPEKLLVGTGTCAGPDTARLAAGAVRAGCGGVLLLPPFFYKGVSDEGIYAAVADIIDRVGHDGLRVWLYHIPPQARVGFSPALAQRLAQGFPGMVVGVKDSSGDWANTKALIEACPGLSVYSGSEVHLLANLRAGGPGAITASANVNARTLRRLAERWRDAGAEAAQDLITRQRLCLQQQPLIPMLKALVAARRGVAPWARPRPPLMTLDSAIANAAIAAYEALQPEATPAQ